jgi:nucleotide-binding universal stress UspA family protein
VTDAVPPQDHLVWDNARHKLQSFKRKLQVHQVPAKTLLDRGDVDEIIPGMIAENHIDLVVLGTHGRRGVSKLILGSSAEKIYRSCGCPVLTIGPHVHGWTDWKLRRILCPVDLSEDPEPVLHYALSLAEENQSEFIVLGAVPMVPWQHRPDVEQRTSRALESFIPEQAKSWCRPQCVVRWEHPAEAILREAVDRQADLIVMSVHKSRVSALSAHLPWPIASEVVSQALCPVLTIRI